MSSTRRLAARVSARSRQRKIEYLSRHIPVGSSVLVVGVSGGSPNTTENVIEHWLFSQRGAVGLAYDQPAPGLRAALVRGDARRLPFADGSFDYVVSNAVIEHVGGVDGARAMLRESSRVSRVGWYHTTPNRLFPVEVHTRVLFLHWAPHRWQERVFTRLTRYRFATEHYWLFTPRAARQLSPSVVVERMGATGMTLMLKSRRGPGSGPPDPQAAAGTTAPAGLTHGAAR